MATKSLIALASVVMLGLVTAAAPDDQREYAKLAPYSGVRWREERIPEVKIGETWHELLAINDVPVEQIIDFAQKIFDDKWKKRFTEDLVEVMTKMDHPLDHTVNLKVKSLETGEVTTLENVPMTKENRRAIRQQRQEEEEQQKDRKK